jgi:DNA-binding NtrC family response regulator
MARVLVVDDNAELAASLAEVIELAGLEALVAEDARALLLDPARAVPFDAALIDAQMLAAAPAALLRALAQHAPAAVYLVMTSRDDTDLAARDLPKPFGPDVVLGALRDAGVARPRPAR